MHDERLHGLRRWEEWLEGRLSPHGIVRESPPDEGSAGAVWRVGFRDDTRARVYVTDGALRLDADGFDDLMVELEELDWIRLLRAARPGGIRIHRDGGLDEVDPAGAQHSP